jgi:hypothetical protein
MLGLQGEQTSSDLDDQFAILPQLRIGREQMQRFADGLGDEQTIKGIGVVHRQIRNEKSVS